MCVALFLLNYEIGSSKGLELYESVVCRYILSTSSLLVVMSKYRIRHISRFVSRPPDTNLESPWYPLFSKAIRNLQIPNCVPQMSYCFHREDNLSFEAVSTYSEGKLKIENGNWYVPLLGNYLKMTSTKKR